MITKDEAIKLAYDWHDNAVTDPEINKQLCQEKLDEIKANHRTAYQYYPPSPVRR